MDDVKERVLYLRRQGHTIFSIWKKTNIKLSLICEIIAEQNQKDRESTR